jgi:uncharacterized Tic20 family protein
MSIELLEERVGNNDDSFKYLIILMLAIVMSGITIILIPVYLFEDNTWRMILALLCFLMICVYHIILVLLYKIICYLFHSEGNNGDNNENYRYTIDIHVDEDESS